MKIIWRLADENGAEDSRGAERMSFRHREIDDRRREKTGIMVLKIIWTSADAKNWMDFLPSDSRGH